MKTLDESRWTLVAKSETMAIWRERDGHRFAVGDRAEAIVKDDATIVFDRSHVRVAGINEDSVMQEFDIYMFAEDALMLAAVAGLPLHFQDREMHLCDSPRPRSRRTHLDPVRLHLARYLWSENESHGKNKDSLSQGDRRDPSRRRGRND